LLADCVSSRSVGHDEIERFVRDKSSEEKVGVVIQPIVELELVEAEQNLTHLIRGEGISLGKRGLMPSIASGDTAAHHIQVRDDSQDALDEDAQHVRVQPPRHAADVLVHTPAQPNNTRE
jgi:ribosomal protein L1